MAGIRASTVVFALAVLASTGASAQRNLPGTGGSVPLTDVMTVAAKYPNLVNQIRLQLLAAGREKSAVVCAANRFSNQWQHLGGARIAPYECAIGKRTLVVSSAATYYDRNGYRLKPDDPSLRSKAARVMEAGLKWQWK